MNAQQIRIAEQCRAGAENGSMQFPEIVAALDGAGFEGYLADLRRTAITYYLPDGDSVALAAAHEAGEVAAWFDPGEITAAVRDAQAQGPDYTYLGFLRRIMAAGCAGYLVSFSGRRVVYYGRTAETHVEHFPASPAPASAMTPDPERR